MRCFFHRRKVTPLAACTPLHLYALHLHQIFSCALPSTAVLRPTQPHCWDNQAATESYSMAALSGQPVTAMQPLWCALAWRLQGAARLSLFCHAPLSFQQLAMKAAAMSTFLIPATMPAVASLSQLACHPCRAPLHVH